MKELMKNLGQIRFLAIVLSIMMVIPPAVWAKTTANGLDKVTQTRDAEEDNLLAKWYLSRFKSLYGDVDADFRIDVKVKNIIKSYTSPEDFLSFLERNVEEIRSGKMVIEITLNEAALLIIKRNIITSVLFSYEANRFVETNDALKEGLNAIVQLGYESGNDYINQFGNENLLRVIGEIEDIIADMENDIQKVINSLVNGFVPWGGIALAAGLASGLLLLATGVMLWEDRDSDGDGVSNKNDRYPYDSSRSIFPDVEFPNINAWLLSVDGQAQMSAFNIAIEEFKAYFGNY